MPKPNIVFTEVMEDSDSDDEIEVIPYVKPPPVVIDLLESEEEGREEEPRKKKSKKKKKDKQRDKENKNQGKNGSEVNDASRENNDNNLAVSLSSASKEQNEGASQTTDDGGRDGISNELVSSQVGDSEVANASESRNVAGNDSAITAKGREQVSETLSSSVDLSQQISLPNLLDKGEPGSRFEKCNDAQSKQAAEVTGSTTMGENMIGTISPAPTSATIAPENDSPTQKRAKTRERKSAGRGRSRAHALQRTNEEIVKFLETLGIPIPMNAPVVDSPPKRKRQPRKRQQQLESETIVSSNVGVATSTGAETLSEASFQETSSPRKKSCASPQKKKRKSNEGVGFDLSLKANNPNDIPINHSPLVPQPPPPEPLMQLQFNVTPSLIVPPPVPPSTLPEAIQLPSDIDPSFTSAPLATPTTDSGTSHISLKTTSNVLAPAESTLSTPQSVPVSSAPNSDTSGPSSSSPKPPMLTSSQSSPASEEPSSATTEPAAKDKETNALAADPMAALSQNETVKTEGHKDAAPTTSKVLLVPEIVDVDNKKSIDTNDIKKISDDDEKPPVASSTHTMNLLNAPNSNDERLVKYRGPLLPCPSNDDAGFPNTWTAHMKEFYGTPKNENFELDDLWYRLPENHRLWQTPNDMMPPPKSKKNFVRCVRCKQFGHFAKECTERYKPPVCHMCGQDGHCSELHSVPRRNSKCPNSRCLNCGQHLNNYTQQCGGCLLKRNPKRCDICNVIGHHSSICPDNWRRYHSVTTMEAFEKVEQQSQSLMSYRQTGSNKDRLIYRKSSSLYCCNCGHRGHTYYYCDENRSNPYHRNKPHAIMEIPPSILMDRAEYSAPSPANSEGYDTSFTSRLVVRNAITQDGNQHWMEVETLQIQIENDLAFKSGNDCQTKPVEAVTVKKAASSSEISSSNADNDVNMTKDDDGKGRIYPCKSNQCCTNKLKNNEECKQVILMRQAHVKLLKAQENGTLKTFEEKHDVQISVIGDDCKVHFCGANFELAEKDLYRFLWNRNDLNPEGKTSTEKTESISAEMSKESTNTPILTVVDFVDGDDDCCIVEVSPSSKASSKPTSSSPSKRISAIADLANSRKQKGETHSKNTSSKLPSIRFDDDTPLPPSSGIYTSFDESIGSAIFPAVSETTQKEPASFLEYESPLTGFRIGRPKESGVENKTTGTTPVANDEFSTQKAQTSLLASTDTLVPVHSENAPCHNSDSEIKVCDTKGCDTGKASPPVTSSIPRTPTSPKKLFDAAEPELVFTIRNDKMQTSQDCQNTTNIEKGKADSRDSLLLNSNADGMDVEIVEILDESSPVLPQPSSQPNIEIITIDEDDDESPAILAVSATRMSLANKAAPTSKSPSHNNITLLESEWTLVAEEFSKQDNVFNEISKFFGVDLIVSKQNSSIAISKGSIKKRQMAKDNIVFWLECKCSKTPFVFLPRGYEEMRKAQRKAMKLGNNHPHTGNKNSLPGRARSLQKMKKNKRALKLIDVQSGTTPPNKKRKKNSRNKSSHLHSNSVANLQSTDSNHPTSSSTCSTSVIAGTSSNAAPLFLPLNTQNHTWSPGFNSKDFRNLKGSTQSHSPSTLRAKSSHPSPKKMKHKKNKNHPPLNTPTSSNNNKPRKRRYFILQ